jgi:hypothetical protein
MPQPYASTVWRLEGPGGEVFRERLVALDDGERSYAYDLLESPRGVFATGLGTLAERFG